MRNDYKLHRMISIATMHNMTDKEIKMIINAYYMAKETHQYSKPRLTGEPYFTHPEIVGEMLLSWGADAYSTSAGLLHDVPEEVPDITMEHIASRVNPVVAFIVDGVTRGQKQNFKNRRSEYVYSTCKLFRYMNLDLRVLLVKLADRLHNTDSFDVHTEERKNRKIDENYNIYSPSILLIGAYEIKKQFDNLTFKAENHGAFEATRQTLAEAYAMCHKEVEKILNTINDELTKQGINTQIEIVPTSIRSSYEKIKQTGSLNKLSDLFEFVIKVDSIEDCYRTFRIIEKKCQLELLICEDYIIKPLYNGYQSLHLNFKNNASIRIRTSQMDKEAKFGSSIPVNKEGVCDIANLRDKIMFSKILNEIITTYDSDIEMLNQIKRELLSGVITVHTNSDRGIILPTGSNIADLFSRINQHNPSIITNIGKVRTGKIDREFDYILQDGDKISIEKGNQSSEGFQRLLDTSKTTSGKKMLLSLLK